ncbi:uncharacterized protein LOC114521127 [Dendronephthya gigantea]|uniref:uncharacterized protein LOC114521127 n=1 Tax=Dendronephthya gigantea TaxID=151771 RepID=UPI001068EC88|nr:uncharacterized protein LOC114521127 [Dendronephthya gigantea]
MEQSTVESGTDLGSGTSLPQFKALFKELLDETKNDILTRVQQNIDQVYSDFDMVAIDDEAEGSIAGISDPGLTDKIDSFVQPAQDSPSVEGSFQTLAEEFSVNERASAPIAAGLAEIVNGLLKDKLPKEKLQELQPKYVRPENCPTLVSPKVNKQIWHQMRQDTRNRDSAIQKAQGLMISGLCAVLEVCNSAGGDQKRVLTHAAVLLLAANREINLKRRDLIRPDLNKQYGSLCNPSVAISTNLFGDDLSKEVEEVSKSYKLGSKVTSAPRFEPYKVSSGRGIRGRGRFHQSAGRGRARSFLGGGRGLTRPPSSMSKTSKSQ